MASNGSNDLEVVGISYSGSALSGKVMAIDFMKVEVSGGKCKVTLLTVAVALTGCGRVRDSWRLGKEELRLEFIE